MSKAKARTPLPTHVKLSFKKHLLPPLAGLVAIGLIFGFFDANLLSGKLAYAVQKRHLNQPASQRPFQTPVSRGAAQLLIDKLRVQAPVDFNQTSTSPQVLWRTMQNGLVHYPHTALPGQEGNVVVFGHSSDDWWAPGGYKYTFSLLDQLQIQNMVYLDYHGQRYAYRIYDIQQVDPSDLTPLNQSSGHILTLITAAPAGDNSKRLAIRASQTAPYVGFDFTSTKAANLPAGAGRYLPGDSGSFWFNFRQLF